VQKLHYICIPEIKLFVDKVQEKILSLLKEVTGKTDFGAMNYKSVDKITKDRIDTKKVRGSVRMMSGKIKTMSDVELMKQAFIALQIP
jgi:hypothetical protein